MDDFSVNRDVLAGDPFAFFGAEKTDEAPHACLDGWVFLGHMVEDESGEEVEVIEAYPCKACLSRSS